MSGAAGAAPERQGRVLQRLPPRWRATLALVLLAGLLFGLRPLSDVNLDFHLNAGRWILGHGAVPTVDTFTYGAAGREYLDLHWLFQAAVYSLFRVVGYAGLSVANALLALGLLALLALRALRLGAGPAATCWVVLAAAVAMHQRFLMRPENVSYVLLALLGLVLDRYLAAGAPGGGPGRGFRGGAAARLLWPAPLIHLLWVNTQGLFVLGLAVTAAYWVTASLRERRPDRPLAAVLALSLAATLANPYGPRGLLFPLELLARLDRADVFARNIGELRPLWEIGGLLEDRVLYAFSAALLVALAATARRRSPHELLLPALFAPLAAVAVRNVPLFVVVSAPILAAALSELSRRLPGSHPEAVRGAASRAGAALCAAVVLGLLARMSTGAFFRGAGLAQAGIGVGLDATSRPVAAARFLLARGLDGRILNSSNTGSWLGWVLPQPVFIDMRLEVMGEELFATEVASWREGGLEPLLAHWRPQIVFLDHGGAARGWIPQLRALADWRLVFADSVAAVYLRRGYAPEVPTLDPAALPALEGVAPARDGGTLGRLLARPPLGRMRRWLAGFHEPSLPDPAPRALGRFCEESGAPAAAAAFYLAALAAAPDLSYQVYGDLAVVLAQGGRPDLALRCYEKYGEYEPGSAWAANGTGMARAMLGDLEGALRDFTTALERDPGSEEARLNRALARLQLGDAAGAARDYRRILAKEPGHEAALEGLRAAERLLP